MEKSNAITKKKKVVISGASGFVGSETRKIFSESGYEVFSLVRRKPQNQNELYFNPIKKEIDNQAFENVSVVINLAGESIYGVWTRKKKQEIISSRIETTRFLAEKILKLSEEIVFISASAVGFYGYETKSRIDESSTSGRGFLAKVCQLWEEEAYKAEKASRVVTARLGVVLGKNGGLLKKILSLTKFGFFGRVGKGENYFSWIAVEEIPLIFDFIIRRKEIKGPINFTSPCRTTSKEFSQTLSRVIGKKELFFIPSLPLRLFGGEMAREMVLNGTNVYPKKLIDEGYTFTFPELEDYLKLILRK